MKTIKKIKYILIMFLATPLFISCGDTIEFEVKDSFDVDISVHSDGNPRHFIINPTSTTIDVSDVIEGKNISNLEVTGVTLKLNNDFRSNSSQNSNFAPGDMLPANIDVKLELGTGSKQLFKGDKNLINEVFQDLELLTPVAIDEFLGSDNKVKLKIVLKFPEVYLESPDFTLDMVVKVRAITSGI